MTHSILLENCLNTLAMVCYGMLWYGIGWCNYIHMEYIDREGGRVSIRVSTRGYIYIYIYVLHFPSLLLTLAAAASFCCSCFPLFFLSLALVLSFASHICSLFLPELLPPVTKFQPNCAFLLFLDCSCFFCCSFSHPFLSTLPSFLEPPTHP